MYWSVACLFVWDVVRCVFDLFLVVGVEVEDRGQVPVIYRWVFFGVYQCWGVLVCGVGEFGAQV